MSLDQPTLGPYRIVSKIGEGGMGAVYLAELSLLGRRAAIKVLLPALSSQREIVDRFFNEARATTASSDPGIVQVFDFGFAADQSAYIVMELLDGESLDTRMQRGTISVADALRLTRQIAGSLAAAHARGIVHRDLKPDNIFIVRDAEAQNGERPKILDFGIAKLTNDGGDRTRTRTGMVMGTPIYMSPEQCRGSGTVDHRSDIYSLGCVLFHLVAGRPPIDYEGVGEIISAHLREPAPAPSTFAKGLPRAVDELVAGCLAKNPDERFASMLDLQRACEAQLARITGAGAQTIALTGNPTMHLPPPQTTKSGSAGVTSPVHRTRGSVVWFALGGVTIALGVAAFALLRDKGRGEVQPEAPPVHAAVPAPLPAPPPDPPTPAPEPVKPVAPPAPPAQPEQATPPAPDKPPGKPSAKIVKPAPHSHAPASTKPTTKPPSGDLYDAR